MKEIQEIIDDPVIISHFYKFVSFLKQIGLVDKIGIEQQEFVIDGIAISFRRTKND